MKDSSSERRRSIVVVCAAALAACSETRAFELPDDRGATLVLVSVAADGAVDGVVVDRRLGEQVLFAARAGDRIFAVLYEAPPDALFLAPGRLELVARATEQRALAPADVYLEAPAEEMRAWVAVERPALLDELALRPVTDAECYARDGWLRLDEDATCGGGGVPLGDVRRCVFSPNVSTVNVPDPETVARAPDMTPCPEGWAQSETEHARLCTPPPRVRCAPGTMQRLAERTCSTIGAPCLAMWPDVPGEVRYVALGGAPGDGSRENPHASIAEAIVVAPSDATIALARGVYRESVVIDRPLAIVGACAQDVVIAPATSTVAVTIDAAGVALRNVKLSGGVRVNGAAELEGVSIEDARTNAIEAHASVVARDVSIVDAGATAIAASAPLELERVVIDGAVGFGVYVRGSTLRFRELHIEDVHTVSGDASAIELWDGAIADGEALSIARSGSGVRFVRAGGEVELAVVDTSTAYNDRRAEGGSALAVTERSSARARRWLVQGSSRAGLFVNSSTATVSDFVVRRGGIERAHGGHGVDTFRAELNATRISISDVIGEGIHVGCSSNVVLRDVHVGGVTAAPDSEPDNGGRGVHLYGCAGMPSGTFHLEKALIERTAVQGVFLEDFAEPRVQATIREVVVRSTGAQGVATFGPGSTALEHARIEGAAASGIRIAGGSHADLTDVLVRGTSTYRGDDFAIAGHGITIAEATAKITRFESSDNAAAGVYLFCPVLDTCEVIDDPSSRFTNGRIFDNRGAGLHLFNVALTPGERACDVLYRNNTIPFSK